MNPCPKHDWVYVANGKGRICVSCNRIEYRWERDGEYRPVEET